jgi:hypothetical protein
MSTYRIKINELNNGKKEYIPQASKFKVFGKWTLRMGIVWENICKSYTDHYFLSSSMTHIYQKEEDALQIIENYKKQIVNENGEKIKSVKYKQIN